MHPEITRELVRSQQADFSRRSARLSAPLRAAGAESSRLSDRRRPLSGSLRSALRQAARLHPIR